MALLVVCGRGGAYAVNAAVSIHHRHWLFSGGHAYRWNHWVVGMGILSFPG